MKTRNLKKSLFFALVMLAIAVMPVMAATVQIYYTGQGFTFDGSTWTLNDQRCGLEGQGIANDGGTGQFTGGWPPPDGTGNFSPGDPYLVWVLTLNASPTGGVKLAGGPFGAGVQMYQVGGTWKYASLYYSPTLTVGKVYAEFDNTGIKASVLKNVQLTVSHGCPPREGGWCSPGFWRNAKDGAWQAAGFADAATGKAALFGETVQVDPNYSPYAVTQPSGVSLGAILNNPQTYSGPPIGEFYSWAANAFNLTGAWLTDRLVGGFDPNQVGVEGACQIDHFGNYK